MQLTDLKNIDRLKFFINECNETQLKYIEPRKIAKKLGISVEEADDMLSYLVESEKATRYFVFQCPNIDCNEEIVVDYDELNEKTECELCNKAFIPSNIEGNCKDIFYEVFKDNEICKEKYNEINFKDKYLKKGNKNNIVPIFKEKDNLIKKENINSYNEKSEVLGKEYLDKVDKNSVFIVHGRDNEAKTEVARYIENLGLKPIILHEQASGGKTIIEKIESYSDVGYAIVIYTPCDVGALKGEEDCLKPRARQNVIFEHGYLYGKIGRNNVCALVKSEVDKPNDMSGVVYTDMDKNGGWKIELARELKSSGYKIDMNKII